MAKKKYNLKDMILGEISFVDKGANGNAHIMIMKGMTKKEGGEDFPAAAFAYVPDPEKPSTWKLRLWDSLAEKETPAQVGYAVAALGKGFRGNKVQIPAGDLSAVKNKVLSAWLKVNSDMTREDAPDILKALVEKEGKTFNEIMNDREMRDKFWNCVYTLEDSLFSIVHDEDITDKIGMMNESINQFQAKIYSLKKGVDMDELEKVKKEKEDLEKRCSALEDENKKLKKETQTEGDGINKADLPEAVAKRLDELEKRDKENSELLAKVLDEKENTLFIEKAKGFSNLSIEHDKFGPILKKVSKALEKEEFETFMQVLKAANEVSKEKGTTEEAGSSGEGNVTKTAMATIEKKAEDLMKVDQTLSKAKAITKVMEENPKLYNDYIEEQSK